MTRYATNRGCRIAWDATGTGPVVLLQHGLLSGRGTWHANGFAAALAPSYTVVCVDSLGHGESERPADPGAYRREARADDLAAVLDALGAARAHVVGYSMGGWMAAAFAARHPARLDSLTLGGWDPVGGRGAAGVPFDAVLAGARARAPQVTAWIDEGAVNGLRACWDALADVDGAEAELAACPAPILLWAGREDPVRAGMEALAARLPGAAFGAVPGDHLGAMTSHAAESASLVRSFLERSSGRPR